MPYILGASSPTYPIAESVYHKGWVNANTFLNGREYYGIRLPLGNDNGKGGPLFFTHYSYMGLDPHGLKDRYADYEEQMKAHTLINRAYCIDNPKGYKGYGEKCWGLTASDGDKGYSAHSPGNDRGVITLLRPFHPSLIHRNILWRPCAISMKNWVTVFGVNMVQRCI